jgi:hypothetical protein
MFSEDSALIKRPIKIKANRFPKNPKIRPKE